MSTKAAVLAIALAQFVSKNNDQLGSQFASA